MTFKVCVNLVGLASLLALATLSSRISEEIQRGKILTTALRLLHLYTFATWLGMQFWVTFVAGEYGWVHILFPTNSEVRSLTSFFPLVQIEENVYFKLFGRSQF